MHKRKTSIVFTNLTATLSYKPEDEDDDGGKLFDPFLDELDKLLAKHFGSEWIYTLEYEEAE